MAELSRVWHVILPREDRFFRMIAASRTASILSAGDLWLRRPPGLDLIDIATGRVTASHTIGDVSVLNGLVELALDPHTDLVFCSVGATEKLYVVPC